MNSDRSSIITSSLTGLFLRIFQLDSSMVSIIFPLVAIVVDKMMDTKLEIDYGIIRYFYKYKIVLYSAIVGIFIQLIILNKKFILNFFEKEQENVRETSVYDICKLENIDRYFAENCVLDCANVNIGDPDTMKNVLSDNRTAKLEFTNIPILNKFVPFEDEVFKIKGFIKWSKEIVETGSNCFKCQSNKVVVLPMIYITVRLNKDDINPLDYISKIEDYYLNRSHSLTLKYIRIFGKSESGKFYKHHIDYYNGKRYSPQELKEKHIDSFFHKEKDRIFSYLYKINYEPDFFDKYGQCPRMNMILYGPTGSGKSSFINRIARALNRHIVSFDVSSIKSKDVVYDIIQKPSTGIGYYSPNTTITVLEEIDIGLKQLQERDLLVDSLAEKIQSYMKSSELSADRKKELEKILEDNDDNEEEVGEEAGGEAGEEAGEEAGGEAGGEDYGNSFRKVLKGVKKKKKMVIMKPTIDVSMYPNNLGNMISQYQDLKKNFMLRDLLDILQGTVSVNGTIIFATTNKFDEIKNFCPELFRHGRMTPIYFGYFEKEQMDQFLKYYFGKSIRDYENKCKIDWDKNGEIKIPTSQLIETALDAKIVNSDSDDAFDYFIKKLHQK